MLSEKGRLQAGVLHLFAWMHLMAKGVACVHVKLEVITIALPLS